MQIITLVDKQALQWSIQSRGPAPPAHFAEKKNIFAVYGDSSEVNVVERFFLQNIFNVPYQTQSASKTTVKKKCHRARNSDLTRLMPVLVLTTYVILSALVTFCSSWKRSLEEHVEQCNI